MKKMRRFLAGIYFRVNKAKRTGAQWNEGLCMPLIRS